MWFSFVLQPSALSLNFFFFPVIIFFYLSFPDGSDGKNLPVMQEVWIRSLSQEDPLDEGMATHPSFLACEILWTEETGGV